MPLAPSHLHRGEPPRHVQLLSLVEELVAEDDDIRLPSITHFKKIQTLGDGRFGEVIKYMDTRTMLHLTGKRVKLEMFDHWSQDMPRIRQRLDTFIEEFRHLHNISYANDRIANFIGFYADDKEMLIFSEFLPNGSVKQRIMKETITEETAVKYFCQAVEALHYLHTLDPPVIHRDIKAANMLITLNDSIKLANFGLVRDLAIDGYGMAVASEISLDFRGTLLYVAPEVLTSKLGPGNRNAYGQPADVWALGCTLIEMLVRSPPHFEYFGHVDEIQKELLDRSKDPDRWLPYSSEVLIPTSSENVRGLVDWMLDRDPSTRPTISAIRDSLVFAADATAEPQPLANYYHHIGEATQPGPSTPPVIPNRTSNPFQFPPNRGSAPSVHIHRGSIQGKRKSVHYSDQIAHVPRKIHVPHISVVSDSPPVTPTIATPTIPNHADLYADAPGGADEEEEETEEEEKEEEEKEKGEGGRLIERHMEYLPMESMEELALRRKRTILKKRRKNNWEKSGICCAFHASRLVYFGSILFKSILYVLSFLLVGLGTLALFLSIAYLIVKMVRHFIEQQCECDIGAPQYLIISGILLILTFALLFSCCMVALGEYKFRVANRSLKESRFFVQRPRNSVTLVGVKIVKGRRSHSVTHSSGAPSETASIHAPDLPQRQPNDADQSFYYM